MKLEINTLDRAIVLAEALEAALQNVEISRASTKAMRELKDRKTKEGKLEWLTYEQLDQMEEEGINIQTHLESLLQDIQPIIDALDKEGPEEIPLPPPNWNGK